MMVFIGWYSVRRRVRSPAGTLRIGVAIALPQCSAAWLVAPMTTWRTDCPKAAAIVLKIVRKEGPISREEIARRYGSLFGKERTGTRIVQATDKALRRLMDEGSPIVVEGRFWMTPDQRDATPVRSRTNARGALQRAEAISPRGISGGDRDRRAGERTPVDARSADRALAGVRIPASGTGLQGRRCRCGVRFHDDPYRRLREMTCGVAGRSQPLARKDRIQGYHCRKP